MKESSRYAVSLRFIFIFIYFFLARTTCLRIKHGKAANQTYIKIVAAQKVPEAMRGFSTVQRSGEGDDQSRVDIASAVS